MGGTPTGCEDAALSPHACADKSCHREYAAINDRVAHAETTDQRGGSRSTSNRGSVMSAIALRIPSRPMPDSFTPP